jgi:hypothetical protein
MSNNYTWTVTKLDTYRETPQPNCIFNVYWKCSGTDGLNTSEINGSTSIEYVQGETYTPYSEVTQEIVLGWIYENGIDKTEVESAITEQLIASSSSQIVSNSLPWATE